MDERRVILLHSQRGTPTTDIACQTKDFLHGHQGTILISGDLGRQFEVDLLRTRDNTYENTRFVSAQHQCLKNQFNRFVQLGSHMDGAQIGLVHHIRNQFIFYLLAVEQPRRIRLLYFLRHFQSV